MMIKKEFLKVGKITLCFLDFYSKTGIIPSEKFEKIKYKNF